MKLFGSALFLCFPFYALALQQSVWISEAAKNFEQVSHVECIEALKLFETSVLPTASKSIPAYIRKHAQDSFEHFCEAKRYIDIEIPRLEIIIEENAQKAANLEEEWQTKNSLDPIKFPDFEGRDTAQQGLYADIGVQRTTIERHRRENKRLFNLAIEDLIIASNGDPDAADDIIRRMLGTLPQPQNATS
jgi:hypothetical protein